MSRSLVPYTYDMGKTLSVLLVVALAVLGGYWYLELSQKPLPDENEPEPTNFAECARLYPVNRSLPRTCTTRTSAVFTEDIGNQLEMRSYITVSTPRPNDTLQSPLRLKGEARSDWFEDGIEIPVEVRDADGRLLGQGHVETDKYTGNLKMLPFEGEVSFKLPNFGHSGTVVIKNTNTREQLVIPVGFK